MPSMHHFQELSLPGEMKLERACTNMELKHHRLLYNLWYL